MDVSVFGLGPVGCVTAACLARLGQHVIGVDIDPAKRELVRNGHCAVFEPGLDALLREGRNSGRLEVGPCADGAVRDSAVSFVCVGTPSAPDGSLDLTYTEEVARQIGAALATKPAYHLVVFRSTMLPGSVEEVLVPLLEQHSGKRAGRDFGVAFNPEFLREGSSIHDFHHPSRTVIGADDARSADLLAALYAGIDAPLVRTSLRTAELVKYADNAFHALKVTFANEVGRLAKAEGIDGPTVMEIFSLDTRLNLSAAYLKPGFAFGGSCLPKDLRALTHRARQRQLELPVLESIIASNTQQKRAALDLVLRQEGRRVGILGLSFKADTNDVRESPVLDLVTGLAEHGRAVRVYDRHIRSAEKQHGARLLDRPALLDPSVLCPNLATLADWADVLVLAVRDAAYFTVTEQLRDDQTLVDLVRIPHAHSIQGRYVGIAW